MAKNVIAFSKRIDFKTILEIECKEAIGFAPVVKNTMDDFLSMLGLLTDVEVVVVDTVTEPSYPKLLKALEAKGNNYQQVFLINDGSPVDSVFPQFSTDTMTQFISQLKNILNPNGVVEMSYISIPIESFIHFKVLPFDLYIKLSEQKFVKCIHGSEDIDEAQLKALEAKGVKELYFEKKFNKEFSSLLINNMINKVESDYQDHSEKIRAADQVFRTTKDIVRSVGLPARVIEVCDTMMESITNDVMQSKDKFSSFLDALKGKDGLSYQFRLVELTSFVATQLVESLPSGNKTEMIKTAVFCSFFCDISLKDVNHLKFRRKEEMKDLWPEEKKEVEDHALKASEIVARYAKAPADAATVIRQHHGMGTGKGFAKPSESLLTVTLCLMASHEIALAILDNPCMSPTDVIKNLIDVNQDSHLLPWFKSFEESCRKQLQTA